MCFTMVNASETFNLSGAFKYDADVNEEHNLKLPVLLLEDVFRF